LSHGEASGICDHYFGRREIGSPPRRDGAVFKAGSQLLIKGASGTPPEKGRGGGKKKGGGGTPLRPTAGVD